MNRSMFATAIIILLLISVTYFLYSQFNKDSSFLSPINSSNPFSTPTPTVNDDPNLRSDRDTMVTNSSNASKGGLDQERVVIVYSDTGFVPNALTISVGQTVTFINESKEMLWVVSGPKRESKTLPSFDQGSAGAKGSFYEYTFTDKGQWSYINDKHPEASGIINVR